MQRWQDAQRVGGVNREAEPNVDQAISGVESDFQASAPRNISRLACSFNNTSLNIAT